MTPEELVDLSIKLEAEAASRTESADSLEQWNAVTNLRSARNYVRSAASWLEMHAEKYEGKEIKS